jgi:hypothetical protein
MSKDKEPSNSSSGSGGFIFPSNTQIRHSKEPRETAANDAKFGRGNFSGDGKSESGRSGEANSKNRDKK